MCINPGKLADGTEIACRKCRLCRDNAVNDWVGRCIAESKTATVSYCFSLTYGRDADEASPFFGSEDHPRAKVLTYSDVQKLIKLLRRHGYDFRYFVVGEYGSEKGRAHWHVVFFFYGRAPALAGFNSFGTWSDRHLSRGFDAKDKIRFMWQRLDDDGKPVMVKGKPAYWWPHGWVEVSEASHGGIRYNTKYIQKDIGKAERQGHLMMSKKPPLGTAYFQQQAEQMVAQGVALRNLEYTFDEARTKKGELVRFWLAGKTATEFILHYIETWWQKRAKGADSAFQREYPLRWLPTSPFLEEWLDRRAAADMLDELGTPEQREKFPTVPKPRVQELRVWMGTRQVVWNKAAQAWEAPGAPGRDTVLRWTFIKTKGAYGWREVPKPRDGEAA